MNQSISLNSKFRGRAIALTQGVVLIIAALMAAAGASALTRFGYDWGYHVVDKLVGQPSSDQLTGAAMLGFWFVPGITVGIFLGYIEKARKSALWRMLVAPMCLISIFAPFLYVALHEGGLSLNDFRLDFGLPEYASLGAAMIVGYGVNYLARHIYAQLKMRTHVIRLTGSLLVGLFAMLLCDPKWMSETPIAFSIYASVLFGVGVVSALALKVKNAKAGWAAALVATLPVTLFDLTNVLFTLTFMATNAFGFGLRLGWRATMSAVVITFVSVLAASLGGLLGGYVSSRQSRSNIIDDLGASSSSGDLFFLMDGANVVAEPHVVNVKQKTAVPQA